MTKNQEIILLIVHNLLNQNQTIIVDVVKENFKLIQHQESDLDEEIKGLVRNGLINVNDNMLLTLTNIGKIEAYKIAKEKNKEDFNRLINSAISSKAYLDFCEEIYGYRMYLFNMMDRIQLDYLFDSISILKNDRILDLGCGTGSILTKLVEKYKCTGIGLDELNEDPVGKDRKSITYINGDLDLLSNYKINPSITLSIDSLYFSSNLDGLITSLKSTNNNRLYLYYSQYIFDETIKNRTILHRDETRIAKALQKNEIPYNTIDYSTNECSLYENALKLLPNYKRAFEIEGKNDLFERKFKEYNIGKHLYENGLASRYLYIVT